MTGRGTLLAVSIFVCLATGPADAAESGCTMIKIADLPVRMVRNKLIVDGAINGKKAGVVIDTGAALTMMVRPAADRLGLERRETRGYRLFGVGGETKAEAVVIDEFRIGQASRKGWRILVAGEYDFGEDIAIFLGEDFFSQVDVEFDLAHSAVRLFQPKNCDGVPLAYWTSEEPGEVAIEPIYEISPRIFITVQINGQPVKAMLDSGASESALTKADAARLGVTPETAGVVAVQSGYGFGPKKVDVWIGPFDSFVIGNESIKHVHLAFSDLYRDATYTSIGSRLAQSASKEQPMLLGADFLRAHRVLVSHSQRKMYFTYVGGPVFVTPRPSESGVEPRTDQAPAPGGAQK